MEACVRATEVRVAPVGARTTYSGYDRLGRRSECKSIRITLALISNTTARGGGHLKRVEVQPDPADVVLALGNGVGEGVWGGGGHVVARVARVDDVGRVFGDRCPTGRH